MVATPPPELADHEQRIGKLENAVMNLSCEIRSLRARMDSRFSHIENNLKNLHIELRSGFESRLLEAMEKLNARMDSQHHLVVGLLVANFLAIIALVAD